MSVEAMRGLTSRVAAGCFQGYISILPARSLPHVHLERRLILQGPEGVWGVPRSHEGFLLVRAQEASAATPSVLGVVDRVAVAHEGL